MSAAVKCPYCAEEIRPDAKKCKHCGEWLAESSSTTKGGAMGRGSSDARAVAKGIKQQKLHESIYKFLIFLAIVVAAFIGMAAQSWFWGIAVLLVLGGIAAVWYQRE